MNAGKFGIFLHFNVQKRSLRKKMISIYICLCGRTGGIVGTTLNSTESGRSQVRYQVAAGAKYGEFSSTQKSHQKSAYQNLTMPTVERPSISSGFSQYSLLVNKCSILYFLSNRTLVSPLIVHHVCRQAAADVKLSLCANSTRRARWHARLGTCQSPTPMLLPLGSLVPDGGVVSCVDVVISRVYPVQVSC